jgi:putative hemolysin
MSLPTHLAAALVARTRPATAYAARLASSEADLRAAQALRFEVFNLKLDEGLVHSHDTVLDVDPFDTQCDHILVEDLADGRVVGTYRLQTGLGYYSEREFDFTPLEPARAQTLDLGRACIHLQHRNFAVLNLLWKGFAAYAREFRTIDFLTWIDVESPAIAALQSRGRFVG